MKRIPILILSAALLAAGCEKNDISGNNMGKIRCRVDVSATKSLPITTAGGATNGTQNPLNIQNLGFGMAAYADSAYFDNATGTSSSAGKYFSKTVTYSNGDWSIADTPTWINDVNLRFFSWSPLSTTGTLTLTKADTEIKTSTMPFTYTTASAHTSASSDDLIFAYQSQRVKYNTLGVLTSGNENVNLTFNHALSQIRFCLSTDDGTYDKTLKLVSIKIKDEPIGGTCIFDGEGSMADSTMFVWTPSTVTNSSAKADFTQTFTDAIFPGGTPETIPTGWVKSTYTKNSNTYNLYTCTGDVLFLVPQKSFTGKKIEITFQKGSSPAFTLQASLPDGTWVAGKYYTYKIKAAKTLSLLLLSGDWIDGGEDISF